MKDSAEIPQQEEEKTLTRVDGVPSEQPLASHEVIRGA